MKKRPPLSEIHSNMNFDIDVKENKNQKDLVHENKYKKTYGTGYA